MSSDNTREERIEARAAEWLAAIETGRADRAAFEAWRAADPAHAIAFLRVEGAWRRLDQLAPHARHTPRDDAPLVPAHPSRRQALVAGGCLAVALAAGGTVVATRAEARTVTTAVGERQRLHIDEGSSLDLNTASSLRWRKTVDATEVRLLYGEVSITLTPGAPRCILDVGAGRLLIQSGHHIARVRPRGRVDVVAVSGTARFVDERGQRPAILDKPGRLSVAPGISRWQPLSEQAIRIASAWEEGELILDGEPLSAAVAEFNRYLPRPLVLGDPAIGTVRLGGRFLTSDPRDFIEALRRNFAIQATYESRRIVLARVEPR